MHQWGDDWFKANGESLNKAMDEFEKICRKMGFILLYGKEKWGCYRDEYLTFWDGGLHYFIYKSPIFIRNNFLYWKVDPIIKFITKFTGVQWLFVKYQTFVYNYAMQKVCKKYPNVIDEMVMDLNGYKMIKPSIFGDVDGEKIHKKYWRTLE
jgi:hypothetical protein